VVAAIQKSEHDTLAVHRRNCGYPKVELSRLEPYADASVLRPSALGDVEIGEQLRARDYGVVQRRGRFRGGNESAVQPEPDPEPLTRGLEMDVARSGIERVTYEEIAEPVNGFETPGGLSLLSYVL
jgi:hypothetical protein